MIYFWLTLSIIVNLSLLFYIRWLLQSIKTMNEQVDSIWNNVGTFCTHLKGVYELETFYGDETLGALLKHSSLLLEEIESFDGIIIQEEELEDVDDATNETPQED